MHQQWFITWWGELVQIFSKPGVGHMHGIGDASSFEFVGVAYINNACIAGLDLLLQSMRINFLSRFRLHSIGSSLEDLGRHHTFDLINADAVQKAKVLLSDASIDQEYDRLIPFHE